MPGLLRSVLSVIEIFHTYAQEDCEGMMLTCRELKQLLQSEFGDIVQPRVIHAVEKSVDLLGIASEGISFEEFILAMCNLLNYCYIEIQSLNLEREQETKSEKKKPDNVDLDATSRNGQQREETPSTQDKIVLPSSQLNPKEGGLVEPRRVDPQDESKVHSVPEEEQSSSPTKGEGWDKEILREEEHQAWEQSGSKPRGQLEEQEGNFGIQGSLAEEIEQGSSEDHKIATESRIKEHSKTQESSLQAKSECNSEHADLPEQVDGKPSQTKRSNDYMDNGRLSETQEPEKDTDRKSHESDKSTESVIDGKVAEVEELGKGDADRTSLETKYSPKSNDGDTICETQEQETKDLPAQSDSRNISETKDVKIERNLEKNCETHGRKGQKERERETQMPDLEIQTQEEKYQETQGPSEEMDAAKESETREPSSTGTTDQSHSEMEGETVPEKDVRSTEKGTEEALVDSRSDPIVEETLGAREGTQQSALLESQSGEKNRNIIKTHDRPIKEDDSHQGEDLAPSVTQNDEGSSEILAPEEGDGSSETSDLPAQEYFQSQKDSQRESMQEDCNNDTDFQKQTVQGEQCRDEEAVELAGKGEAEQLTEEQEVGSQDSEAKGQSTDGHPEAQQPKAESENRNPAEIETPGVLDADCSDQLPVVQQPAKGNSKSKLKGQSSDTKEEGGAPEIQETPLENLHEDNSGFPETEETASLQEEDKSPQELTENDDQQYPGKIGYYSPVSQPGLKESMQRSQLPCSTERDSVQPSPLYNYLQEKITQQTDITQEEYQNEAEPEQQSGPEHSTSQSRVSLTGEIPDSPDHSQELQQYTRDLPSDEAPTNPEQTSAPQALEDKQGHPQRKEPLSPRGVSDTKQ
ncbi:PREDICTED: trichohyalin-like protein 1-like [Elephantulus edwardii]|uniref:trichohyalin-like protein 1-like n=1 Tax=Elephantulus edwardii TaxID=28737 RepID=UPI0003F0C1C9|nr:PREDICTED: trichohyalin-like protein 1-like [Elephantulus edwardii]